MGRESVSVGPDDTVRQFKCVARTVQLLPADGPPDIKENFPEPFEIESG